MIESRESCYRVAVLSGSLEVSARLKNSDDLELLVRVLEANKVLFAKPEEFETRNCGDDKFTRNQLLIVPTETQSVGEG